MKAVMKSMVLPKLNSRTSTGICSIATVSRNGKMREKIIVWEILWISGEDWR